MIFSRYASLARKVIIEYFMNSKILFTQLFDYRYIVHGLL